jgi:arylformamidase
LDPERARSLSPYRNRPSEPVSTAVLVGQNETEEYLRQSALLAAAWPESASIHEVRPGLHHLSILDDLARPASETFASVARLLSLGRR